MNALAILTLNPRPELITFYKSISRHNYDVYFIVDNNTSKFIIDQSVNYVQIDDYFCEASGFHLFNPVIEKPGAPSVSAWDKAMFYFSKLNRSYDNIWLVEDDVFVPDVNIFPIIDEMFPTDDLLSQQNISNTSGETESWPWWKCVPQSNLPLPWARSIVCALRVSKKMLRVLEQYVSSNKSEIKFIEYIFHTLALHNKLVVRTVENLNGIAWKRDWLKEELNAQTIYHPVKSSDQQAEFRNHFETGRQAKPHR